MKEWQISSLELFDVPARIVGDYFSEKMPERIKRIQFTPEEKNQVGIKCNRSQLADFVKKAIGTEDHKNLIVYGGGWFHHYTYGLCRLADRISDNYGYIHFDHHTDFASPDNDSVSFAGFVDAILEDTNASKAFFVGSNVPRLIQKRLFNASPGILEWQLRNPWGKSTFRRKLSKLPEQVYLTFDLDLLSENELYSDFDQGELTAQELFELVDIIKSEKEIISADVLGYSSYSRTEDELQIYGNLAEMITR